MEDIEKILSRTSREALSILPPTSFTNIIQNSLKEKKDHSMFSAKKWITAIATILIICITSLCDIWRKIIWTTSKLLAWNKVF